MSEVAVVTGAGSGIGAATVKRFQAKGYKVLGVDLSQESETTGLAWVKGDVGVEATWQAVEAKLRALGWEPSILVTAAAYLKVGTVLTLKSSDWMDTLNVNIMGLVQALRSVLPEMIARHRGSIVTIGSIDSYMAEQGLVSYCASKGAILQMTKTIALDHARDGIRANCVCPGITDTPFFRRHVDAASDPVKFLAIRKERNPLGRLLTPDEIAATVAFVASDDASGITGAQIVVDAGLTTGFDFRTAQSGA